MNKYAVKISRNVVALSIEKRILQHLHNHSDIDWQGAIPYIVDHGTWGLDAPFDSHILVYSDIYKEVEEWNVETVMKVWSILQNAHRCGIAHCDVRCPNVMTFYQTCEYF